MSMKRNRRPKGKLWLLPSKWILLGILSSDKTLNRAPPKRSHHLKELVYLITLCDCRMEES